MVIGVYSCAAGTIKVREMHLPWKRCKRVKVASSRERISLRNATNLGFFCSGTENVRRSVSTRCPRKMRRRVGTETHLAMCNLIQGEGAWTHEAVQILLVMNQAWFRRLNTERHDYGGWSGLTNLTPYSDGAHSYFVLDLT